jgi:hypothetical protein
VFLAAAVVLCFLAPGSAKERRRDAFYAAPEHDCHATLEIDAEKRQATVYLLEKTGKIAMPIKGGTVELIVEGVADPVVLEPVPQKGKGEATAHFAGKHELFGGKIAFDSIRVRIKVDGKTAWTLIRED